MHACETIRLKQIDEKASRPSQKGPDSGLATAFTGESWEYIPAPQCRAHGKSRRYWEFGGKTLALYPVGFTDGNTSTNHKTPYHVYGTGEQNIRTFDSGLSQLRQRGPSDSQPLHAGEHRTSALPQELDRHRAVASGRHHTRPEHRPHGSAANQAAYRRIEPGTHRYGGVHRQLDARPL